MADTLPVEEVADAMFALLKEYHGKKRFKAGDLQKEMVAKFGKDRCDRKLCKAAIKMMMEDGRTIYGYAGGSWIEPVTGQ
jgi:ATP-dependent protease HslVU (ClpYQ) peptidase subunit